MSTMTETATELLQLQPLSRTSVRIPPAPASNSPPPPSIVSNYDYNFGSSPGSSATQKSNLRTFLAIFTPSFVGFSASFTNGCIVIGLPVIARSISLERSLYLWPSSVYGLTSGAALLIAGSIADIVGAKPVELVGIIILGIFTLCCGFAQTGAQLVAFRAIQGLGLAMHLPASVAIITSAAPSGKARNLGFACLGFSQPLGFATGLIISGIMIERLGWRSGFFLIGGCSLATAVAAIWTLPNTGSRHKESAAVLFKRVCKEIDWVGGLISSGGLSILAYVLANVSANVSSIRSAETASLLAVGIVLLLAFPAWMHHRERTQKAALVPNKLWKILPFTSVCIMVALSYGALNSIELFSSLYFQEVQQASPLKTSLFLLPNFLMGIGIELFVGMFVHRVAAIWLVAGSSLICALSPLLMAVVPPTWSYWKMAFWAQIFGPFSGDVLFTVGLIIVSDSFPEETQALAGAVFNTVAQFGMSLGLGTCQVVALAMQGNKRHDGNQDDAPGQGTEDQDGTALLQAYRASFWLMFAYMILVGFIALVGLRKAGKVGLKRE